MLMHEIPGKFQQSSCSQLFFPQHARHCCEKLQEVWPASGCVPRIGLGLEISAPLLSQTKKTYTFQDIELLVKHLQS